MALPDGVCNEVMIVQTANFDIRPNDMQLSLQYLHVFDY